MMPAVCLAFCMGKKGGFSLAPFGAVIYNEITIEWTRPDAAGPAVFIRKGEV